MSKKAPDRRVPRTKAMLQQALYTLLRKKRYEAITIRDICSAANVGRSTFYAHFKCKDDLKRSGLEDLHTALAQRQRASRNDPGNVRELDFSLQLFEHAYDHVDHYRTLARSRGSTVALTKIRQMVTDLVRTELASRDPRHATQTIAQEVAVQYAAGAYMALLTWWLDGGAKLPPQRVDAMFRRLTTRGIFSGPHAFAMQAGSDSS